MADGSAWDPETWSGLLCSQDACQPVTAKSEVRPMSPEQDRPLTEAEYAATIPPRMDAIAEELNERLGDVLGGMRFEWDRAGRAALDALVPAALTEQIHAQLADALGLKPWQVGTAPAPWHARARRRIRRTRQWTAERAYRLIAGHDAPEQEW